MSPSAELRPSGHPALHTPLKRAAGLGAAAAVVVGCGLAARQLPGVFGDVAGGALYAVLVYVLLGLAALALRRIHRETPLQLAAAALVVCTLVELFQLTQWPARLGEAWSPLHLVFGSTFNLWDLVAYAVGAVSAAVSDTALSRAAR